MKNVISALLLMVATTALFAQKTTIEWVSIPDGTFNMGSPETEVNRSSDETQYSVTLTAFRLSKYEITNAQYADFLNTKSIGENGKYAAGAYPTETLIYASSGSSNWGLNFTNNKWIPVAGYENHPVIFVTCYGATEFATYVSGALPTEAQWEYACRAGTTTPFNTGNFLINLQANYDWAFPYNGGTNTVTTYPGKTKMVGTYTPNAFGLCDMHGNVWEWCAERDGTTFTVHSEGGSVRMIRGGGWNSKAQDCRSVSRTRSSPRYNSSFIGFRVVLIP